MTDPTDGERAAFEAGIKFGALYHQFAGTPVSPGSAPSLATAMEEAIENQPFCEAVDVRPHEDRIRRAIGDDAAGGDASDAGIGEGPGAADVADYTELTGELFDATIEVERAETRVRAELATEGEYPLMRLADVDRE